MGGPRVETRISLVLYGGVSLAVYISGACQELLSVVRATAEPALVRDTDLTRAERVYRELAGSAGPGGTQMRVTVDVLSGSSAGGLNAVFLGKALAHGGSLDGLTEIWRAEADFLKLLNDSADPPKSVLNGDRFYKLLLGALDDMGDGAGRLAGLVPAVDCFLTTTDLRGVAENVRLYDTSIQEVRRRARFHFRDGLGSAMGAFRDDLRKENNAVLAFAARATAAHPAAFHPANWRQVNDLTPDVAAPDVALDKFLSPAHGPDGPVNVKLRWYSDGGAMDNKPFAYALEPLSARRADIPVERRIVYVEPDPSRSTGDWQDPRLPKLFDYTAGTYGLARTENIRDDIAALNARNEEIARLNESLSSLFERTDDEILEALRTRIGPAAHGLDGTDLVELGLDTGYDRDRSSSGVVGGWTAQTRIDFARERGWGAVAQEDYRWSTVVTSLVETALQVGEIAPDPSLVRNLSDAVKLRLEEWVRTRHPGAQNVARVGLVIFDVGFRLRRFTLLEHLISHHQRRLVEEGPGIDAGGSARFDLYAVTRRDINKIYLDLTTFAERRRAFDFRLHDPEVLRRRTLEQWVASDDFLAVVDRSASALELPLSTASNRGREVIRNADIDQSMRYRLADAWLNYGDYDQLILPLSSIASAELDPADVVRISPLDADGLIAEATTAARKLGGNALGHFGGFLNQDWRLNDILWGRLDTAEVAVKKVLGASADDARRVQRALLEDLAIDHARAPSAPSPLRSLLAVNQWPETQLHKNADRALDELVRSSSEKTSREEVDDNLVARTVDAILQLLTPDDDESESWTVDVSTGGERGDTKIELFERGARVVGTTLARQAEDPFTGGDLAPPPTKSWMAFVGRMISWIVRRALPTKSAQRIVSAIAGLMIAAGVAGVVAVCITEPWGWLACLLVVGGSASGAGMTFWSLRRVRPLATWAVIMIALFVGALIVLAVLVNWLAAAAGLLFMALIAAGVGFWSAMTKIRKTLKAV